MSGKMEARWRHDKDKDQTEYGQEFSGGGDKNGQL